MQCAPFLYNVQPSLNGHRVWYLVVVVSSHTPHIFDIHVCTCISFECLNLLSIVLFILMQSWIAVSWSEAVYWPLQLWRSRGSLERVCQRAGQEVDHPREGYWWRYVRQLHFLENRHHPWKWYRQCCTTCTVKCWFWPKFTGFKITSSQQTLSGGHQDYRLSGQTLSHSGRLDGFQINN